MPSIEPCAASNGGRFLRQSTRFGVGVLFALAVTRAVLYLVYAAFEIPTSDQPYMLEGASVHFAWCVEQGLPLYPEGLGPSYSANYMGPCYFWIVGFIGRLFDADIYGLYVIGRVVTFACSLGPAVIAALYLRRRFGRWAGFAGFIFGLGSAPMFWYGARTRPDMMADVLGVAGFFLACRPQWRWMPWAAILLAMSCLTKQSFGVLWLLAAMVAVFASSENGSLRNALRNTVCLSPENTLLRALILGGTTTVLVVATVAALAATCEPHIVQSLLGQGKIAFSFQQSLGILLRVQDRSAELVLFVMIGCALWMSGKYKDRALLILAVAWLLGAALTSAKIGSDLNYFIPLRIVEAIAAGMLCVAAYRSSHHRLGWAMATWTGVLAMAMSTAFAVKMTTTAVERRTSEAGQIRRQLLDRHIQLAKDPSVRLLTDSDRLAVYQGERAAFLDIFLFRLEVEAGQRDPQELIDRINSRWFQHVILSTDAAGMYDDDFILALPKKVAAAVVANYRLQSSEGGIFVYVPQQGHIR